jgi:mpaB/rubber oxygenase-like protein
MTAVARWTDAFLDAKRQDGDPVADAAIAALFEKGAVPAVSALLTQLVRNDGIPPAIQAEPVLAEFLSRTGALPAWARPDLIATGEAVFLRWGLVSFVILECASLPECYVLDDVAAVLGMTQRLTDHVHRRVLETGQMVVDVMAHGGLAPHGGGIRVTQKVRLMHAAVRHLILSPPPSGAAAPSSLADTLRACPWDARHGRPVSQEMLAAVLMTFSHVMLRGWATLGIRLSSAEAEAYLHCWNVVGHVLGVSDDLLPTTVDEAAALFEAIKRRRAAATADGQALTASLMTFSERFVPWPRWLFAPLVPLLVHDLLSPETCRLVGLPPLGVGRRLHAAVLRPLARVVAQLRSDVLRDHPGASVVSAWLAQATLRQLVRLPRGGTRGAFTIPDQLARAWRLTPGH